MIRFTAMQNQKDPSMLVAHGILQLHYSDDTNDVIFQIAKSSHDETILVLQYDPYWISMNSYVDLTN